MYKNLMILLVATAVIALPFIFQEEGEETDWKAGDPELVCISAHNEAIRFEFGPAFSDWHAEKYGSPVKVEWRVVGGTTEIRRFLESGIISTFRPWWKSKGNDWNEFASISMFKELSKIERDVGRELEPEEKIKSQSVYNSLRSYDDPKEFTMAIDVFFGGGEYDHNELAKSGLTVNPWPDRLPKGLSESYPAKISGETWRTDKLYGCAVSTFGLCYNLDRLAEVELDPPTRWEDLADPKLRGKVGVADPTKSGSISKAFEMIIHQQIAIQVAKAGITDAQIAQYEKDSTTAPASYQAAIDAGWLAGVSLVQRIGANARYWTDSSSKIPVDVGAGDAAVGLAIDFYGRFQSEIDKRMGFTVPIGGSSVSADPVSLLRGAPNREIAVRFMEFVLSSEGQKIWCYRPGTPGGPHKFSLQRTPIFKEFYPGSPEAAKHAEFTTTDLSEETINPYAMAKTFTYHSGWTGRHFSILRKLIRAMCLDSGEELRATWNVICENGGPEAQPEAMKILTSLPDNVGWLASKSIPRNEREKATADWVTYFRKNYAAAKEAVQ